MLTILLSSLFSTWSFSQGKTPDFWITLGKTNYFIDLSKGSPKAKNDTVFYNLYRYGSGKRIGKEIKHIVSRATGDTLKSGRFETKENQIFFYLKEKNKPLVLKLYTQNAKGLLSAQTSIVSNVDPPQEVPLPVDAPYDSSAHPEKVDIPAEFPGGINKAREFIANNIRYPEEAVENEVNGTVQVKFTIEIDGSLTNIVIIKKLGYGCDEEVIRVLKRMPKWMPAKLKGKYVRSYYTMPVSFKS